MVEQGLLVLLEGERTMPLLEAYSLVSSPSYGCSWDNYQVYSYLRKLGYIVGRHNVLWTLPKKRPPPQVESLTGQFADIKVSDDLLFSHTVASSSETDASEFHFPMLYKFQQMPFQRRIPFFCLCTVCLIVLFHFVTY